MSASMCDVCSLAPCLMARLLCGVMLNPTGGDARTTTRCASRQYSLKGLYVPKAYRQKWHRAYHSAMLPETLPCWLLLLARADMRPTDAGHAQHATLHVAIYNTNAIQGCLVKMLVYCVVDVQKKVWAQAASPITD